MSHLVTTTFIAPRALADAMLALTDNLPGLSLDVGETTQADDYRYTFFLMRDDTEAFIAEMTASHPSITLDGFTDVDTSIDYVAENRKNFPPLTIGPFFIARNDEDAPAGLIKLDIMPNRAFGSGEHATTTGCLLGYTHLVSQGHTFKNGLDFGAGSGILAIAAAKQTGTPFVCIDNDAPSVVINTQNAALNGVSQLITAYEGDVPPEGQTFDLVFANILLQPLLDLSSPLSTATSPQGYLILSGFTTDQSDQIAAAYTARSMKRVWEHQQGDWLAQIWQHTSA